MSPRIENACAARLLDQPLGLARLLVLAEIGDEQIGALAGEGQRHRAPDAESPPVMSTFLSRNRPEPL